ncbi:unnamed protein product [Moneuplotes crassus]|uniref:Uncharacterized protein n=1 Tax=Euplotes crassus TaxID=5936 RepID=A0AAD1UD32_EUPCR|nr:unnamed protein product [Moneuplotes crassus]
MSYGEVTTNSDLKPGTSLIIPKLPKASLQAQEIPWTLNLNPVKSPPTPKKSLRPKLRDRLVNSYNERKKRILNKTKHAFLSEESKKLMESMPEYKAYQIQERFGLIPKKHTVESILLEYEAHKEKSKIRHQHKKKPKNLGNLKIFKRRRNRMKSKQQKRDNPFYKQRNKINFKIKIGGVRKYNAWSIISQASMSEEDTEVKERLSIFMPTKASKSYKSSRQIKKANLRKTQDSFGSMASKKHKSIDFTNEGMNSSLNICLKESKTKKQSSLPKSPKRLKLNSKPSIFSGLSALSPKKRDLSLEFKKFLEAKSLLNPIRTNPIKVSSGRRKDFSRRTIVSKLQNIIEKGSSETQSYRSKYSIPSHRGRNYDHNLKLRNSINGPMTVQGYQKSKDLIPHNEFIRSLDNSMQEVTQKYGFDEIPKKKKITLEERFNSFDQDFKKLLHRDAYFAKIYKNEEQYDKKLLGKLYYQKKMRMTQEEREFEVYKKFVNWALVCATDEFMIKKKQLSTIRSSPPKDKGFSGAFRKPNETLWTLSKKIKK